MLFFLIAITAIVSGLIQLVAHLAVVMYFPQLDLVERYVLGTLGLLVPPSVYLALTGNADALLVLWACAGVSGLAVIGARKMGAKITEMRNKLDRLERYEQTEKES
jgi:hypothetical protein